MKVLWLRQAALDMEQLIEHISQDKPSAAANYAKKLMDAISQLAGNQSLGRPGRVFGTRELVVPPCIVAYRVKGEAVQVLRILHSARKWPGRMGDRA